MQNFSYRSGKVSFKGRLALIVAVPILLWFGYDFYLTRIQPSQGFEGFLVEKKHVFLRRGYYRITLETKEGERIERYVKNRSPLLTAIRGDYLVRKPGWFNVLKVEKRPAVQEAMEKFREEHTQ
ncbi:MAG: hypothetical protein ACLFVQ_03310 [Chitinispirillaceae bacterium]